MLKPTITVLAACLLGAACTNGAPDDPLEPTSGIALERPKAPEFSGITNWFNSEPLTLEGLKGKVVLVEFWTYDCINCIRVLPHVKEWHERYKDEGLVVVGIHTPEYGRERIPANVEKAIKRFKITYPVAQDNEYKTWNAFENRYWPALYLFNEKGEIVHSHFGEGAYAETEARIREALDESKRAAS